MTVRLVATMLLGAAAIAASPATSKPTVSSQATPDRSVWPPTLRAAIEATDAKCLGRRGVPGQSPDLVKMGPANYPVYVLDLNAYECRGVKPTPGPAAVTIYSGATGLPSVDRRSPVPPGDVVQSFTVSAYASRIVNSYGDFLSISEAPDCGRPDAANIFHRRWEWCSRSVAQNGLFGEYRLLAARPLSTAGEIAWAAGNFAEAARLWTAAADQGDVESMVNLAGMYGEGKKGVPQDETRAFALYRRAAEAPAAARAATGQPPPRPMLVSMARPYADTDPDNAANVLAMLELALAYEEGHGVTPDQAQAAAWFRRWAASTVNPALREQRLKTLAGRNIQP